MKDFFFFTGSHFLLVVLLGMLKLFFYVYIFTEIFENVYFIQYIYTEGSRIIR